MNDMKSWWYNNLFIFSLQKAINWVSSDKPVGTPITDDLVEVVRISAGKDEAM